MRSHRKSQGFTMGELMLAVIGATFLLIALIGGIGGIAYCAYRTENPVPATVEEVLP